MYRDKINKSFLRRMNLSAQKWMFLFSKWNLDPTSILCLTNLQPSFTLTGYILPRSHLPAALCSSFSGGSFHCCLFSWHICAAALCGFQTAVSVQVFFGFDHYLVTFPPEFGHSLSGTYFSPWYSAYGLQQVAHVQNTMHSFLLVTALAGWGHRQTVDLICTVLTSSQERLRLTAHHKRWGQNVDWFWKFNYDAVSQWLCKMLTNCIPKLLTGFQWHWMSTVYATFRKIPIMLICKGNSSLA